MQSSNSAWIGPADAKDAGYQVVVIDDHEMFSAALVIALRDRGIAAQSVPVDRLGELATRPCGTPTGVVVLDLYLGVTPDGRRIKGYEWIRMLGSRGWSVLVVTGSEQDDDTAAAIAEGAAGVVSKGSPLDVVLDAVGSTVKGESLITDGDRIEWEARHNVGRVRRREVEERLARLSAREREVLEAIGRGQRAADIAKQSLVSLTTVRAQIRSILVKFGVNSQIEAVALLREYPDAM